MGVVNAAIKDGDFDALGGGLVAEQVAGLAQCNAGNAVDFQREVVPRSRRGLGGYACCGQEKGCAQQQGGEQRRGWFQEVFH